MGLQQTGYPSDQSSFGFKLVFVRAFKSCKEIFHILGCICLCILKIIIDGVVHIQTELSCLFRLCRVGKHQELIGAVLFRNIDALGRKGKFDPQFCCFRVFAALEDRRRADLEGRAVFRNDQTDVVITLQDLINAVMQEADTDDAFTCPLLTGFQKHSLSFSIPICDNQEWL